MSTAPLRWVHTPFDSDDYPKAVLVQGDDVASSSCDTCGRPAEDWPHRGYGRPAAMFRAALYCADCSPHAFDETTGARVHTLTGEEDVS